MAHLETIRTGFRVETRVRGRVYRSGGDVGRRRVRVERKTVQRRLVCLLSSKAAWLLEEFSISQPCHGPECNHAHHTRAKIQALVQAGELRWVGKGQNVAAWAVGVKAEKGATVGGDSGGIREWRGMKSQGYSTMQLVEPSDPRLDRRHVERSHAGRA